MDHVFITVLGGVAEVDEQTVPENVEIHVIDFDNLGTICPESARKDVLSPIEIAYVERYNPGYFDNK